MLFLKKPLQKPRLRSHKPIAARLNHSFLKPISTVFRFNQIQTHTTSSFYSLQSCSKFTLRAKDSYLSQNANPKIHHHLQPRRSCSSLRFLKTSSIPPHRVISTFQKPLTPPNSFLFKTKQPLPHTLFSKYSSPNLQSRSSQVVPSGQHYTLSQRDRRHDNTVSLISQDPHYWAENMTSPSDDPNFEFENITIKIQEEMKCVERELTIQEVFQIQQQRFDLFLEARGSNPFFTESTQKGNILNQTEANLQNEIEQIEALISENNDQNEFNVPENTLKNSSENDTLKNSQENDMLKSSPENTFKDSSENDNQTTESLSEEEEIRRLELELERLTLLSEEVEESSPPSLGETDESAPPISEESNVSSQFTSDLVHIDTTGVQKTTIPIIHSGRGVGKTRLLRDIKSLLENQAKQMSSKDSSSFAQLIKQPHAILHFPLEFSPQSSTPYSSRENQLGAETILALRMAYLHNSREIPFDTFVKNTSSQPLTIQSVLSEIISNYQSQYRQPSIILISVDDIDMIKGRKGFISRQEIYRSSEIFDVLSHFLENTQQIAECPVFPVAVASSASGWKALSESEHSQFSLYPLKLSPLKRTEALKEIIFSIEEHPDVVSWIGGWNRYPLFLKGLHLSGGNPLFIQFYLQECLLHAVLHRYQGLDHMANEKLLSGDNRDQFDQLVSGSRPVIALDQLNYYQIFVNTLHNFKTSLNLFTTEHLIHHLRFNILEHLVFGTSVDPQSLVRSGFALTWQDIENLGWISLDSENRVSTPFPLMMELVAQTPHFGAAPGRNHSVLGQSGIESSLLFQSTRDFALEVEALRRDLFKNLEVPITAESGRSLFPKVLAHESMKDLKVFVPPGELIFSQDQFPNTISLSASFESTDHIIKQLPWWNGFYIVANGEERNLGFKGDLDPSKVNFTRLQESEEEQVPNEIISLIDESLKIDKEFEGFFPIDGFSIYPKVDHPQQKVLIVTQTHWPRDKPLDSSLLLQRLLNLNEVWIELIETVESKINDLQTHLLRLNEISKYESMLSWVDKVHNRDQMKKIPKEIQRWSECLETLKAVREDIVLLAITPQEFAGTSEDVPPNCMVVAKRNQEDYFGPTLCSNLRAIQSIKPIQFDEMTSENYRQIPGVHKYLLEDIEKELTTQGRFSNLNDFIQRIEMKNYPKRFLQAFFYEKKARSEWMPKDWRIAAKYLKADSQIVEYFKYVWDTQNPYEEARKDLRTGGRDAPGDIIQWHSSEEGRHLWEKDDPTSYLYTLGNFDMRKNRWQILRESQEKLLGRKVAGPARREALYAEETPLGLINELTEKGVLEKQGEEESWKPLPPPDPVFPKQAAQEKREEMRYTNDYDPAYNIFDQTLDYHMPEGIRDQLFPLPPVDEEGNVIVEEDIPPEGQEN